MYSFFLEMLAIGCLLSLFIPFIKNIQALQNQNRHYRIKAANYFKCSDSLPFCCASFGDGVIRPIRRVGDFLNNSNQTMMQRYPNRLGYNLSLHKVHGCTIQVLSRLKWDLNRVPMLRNRTPRF